MQAQPSLNSVASEKLGEKYEVSYNSLKTYALCQQVREGDHSQRSFKFIVIRTTDNKIVEEGSYTLGYIKWLDNDSLEVFNSSIRNDAGEKRIIKINSGQL